MRAARSVCVSLLLLLGVVVNAEQVCTEHGQVRVPCHDELQLARADKFLLTLVGHSCYSLAIVSALPLEVYFYDAAGMNLRGTSGTKHVQPANTTSMADTLVMLDPHLCHSTQSCIQVRQGLSPKTLYSLVISRSRDALASEDGNAALPNDENDAANVLLDLQHCDPVSTMHYVGLLLVASLGFTSVLLLLCLVGEFVLGLRSVTKLRKAVDKIKLVELPQMETVVDLGESDKLPAARLSEENEAEATAARRPLVEHPPSSPSTADS